MALDDRNDHKKYELGSARWIIGLVALFLLTAFWTSRQEHPGVAPDRPAASERYR